MFYQNFTRNLDKNLSKNTTIVKKLFFKTKFCFKGQREYDRE
jgi:hypothetical protein